MLPLRIQPALGIVAVLLIAGCLPVADASAVVMRRYNESPHDVILLQSSAADAALLISAVFVLLVARELEGDSPRTSSILRVSREQAPREWQISEEGRAKEVVSRVLRAAPREVPGVGRVSAVDISLRPGVLRGKLRAKP
jgi:hypothetical protein